jgi:hypothetical protein
MTVGELIKELKTYEKDRVVILQQDPEGNGYYSLDGIYPGAWDKKRQNAGLERLTEGDIAAGFTEEDIVKGRGVKPALFLVPG